MKENDGRASRRKTNRQLVYGGGIVLVLLIVGWKWADSQDPSDDPNHLRLLRQAKKHAAATRRGGKETPHEYDEAKVIQRVLDGDLQLIDVTVEEKELLRAPQNSYAGVYGKFCRLDWSRRKVDPSAGTCVCVCDCVFVEGTKDRQYLEGGTHNSLLHHPYISLIRSYLSCYSSDVPAFGGRISRL